jgi:predicted ATPase/DNA-binding winged helix-turn-helix (wHTH) protein
MLEQLSRDEFLTFGPFRLFPTQRLLFDGDRPVALGSRAMELLVALVRRPGELMSKQELMTRVWPHTTVVEANLAVNIATLREAIGDGRSGARYIVNSPGRGYRFVAPVTVGHAPQAGATPAGTMGAAPNNLPARLTRLIGRGEVVGRLVGRLAAHRLFTIVGPGGIGKTAVAVEVAEACTSRYRDGVWLVDFAPIDDPRLVPEALASTLKLKIRSDEPLPDLTLGLRDKQMLLVLDNCEHVIDAAAALAGSLLSGAREVRILATSREPLRAEGEQVHRLPPLDSPPAAVRLSASTALAYPAVQLFVERTAASLTGFELNDDDATSAGEICRQLDGVPLAIEFAAARVIALGVRGLAAQLDERLKLLTGGRRTALPRHQTISAVLDWSYQLLNPDEQTVFRRLAIFSGSFSMEAAAAVLSDEGLGPIDVAAHVSELVAKSMVSADVFSAEPRFRLMETTRVYADLKILENGERDTLERRRAEYCLRWIADFEKERAASKSRDALLPEIDNIRASLSWAFSAGDKPLGVSLAAAAAPLCIGMSLLSEFHTRMADAVAALASGEFEIRPGAGAGSEPAVLQSPPEPMLGTAGSDREAGTDLSTIPPDREHRFDSLLTVWLHEIRLMKLKESLAIAKHCMELSGEIGDISSFVTSSVMLGMTFYNCGELNEARVNFEQALLHDTPGAQAALLAQYGINRRIDCMNILANLLWKQGFPTRALQVGAEALEQARADARDISTCQGLVFHAINLQLAGADAAAIEAQVTEALELAKANALGSHIAAAECFLGLALVRRGQSGAGQDLFEKGFAGQAKEHFHALRPFFLIEFCKAVGEAGRPLDALARLASADGVLREEHVWTAEMLRVQGELTLAIDERGAAGAEGLFNQSLDLARRQGALSWELRSSTSLARLYRRDGRAEQGRELLEAVYQRFTEGFETADLKRARSLLDELNSAPLD